MYVIPKYIQSSKLLSVVVVQNSISKSQVMKLPVFSVLFFVLGTSAAAHIHNPPKAKPAFELTELGT